MEIDPRLRHRTTSAAAVLFVTACLAACGGGSADTSTTVAAAPAAAASGSASGSAASASAPAAAASPASAASAPASSTTAFAGSTCNIPDFAATLVVRVNQLRAAGADCRSAKVWPPTGPLTMNALLTQAAEAHSQDMVANKYFGHDGFDGRTFDTRITATGYVWSDVAENIAAGYPTIDKVLAGWMASDGHCANLMAPQYKEMGLVCVPGKAGVNTYTDYWTMDLAQPG